MPISDVRHYINLPCMESRKMAGVEISFLKLKSDMNTLVYTYYDCFHLYEIKFHVQKILFANFKKIVRLETPKKRLFWL